MALGCLFAFVHLGAGSLANDDDGFYAWSVRQADREGAWLTYRWNGARLDFRYPPLHFFALRATTALFGHNELGLRLPAALALVACMLLVGALVRRLTGSTRAALVAGLLVCASGLLYRSARSVRIDVTLAAVSAATIYSYVLAWRRPRQLWLTGALGGLAVMTKGVMGLLPTAAVVLHMLLPSSNHSGAGERRLLGRKTLLGGALAFVVVAAPWHIWQLVQHGGKFVDTYILYTVFRRVGGIAGLRTADSLLTTVLFAEQWTLLPLAAGALWATVRLRRDPGARLLWLWALMSIAPSVVSGTRLPHYLVVAVPPLAAAAGCAVAPHLKQRKMAVLAVVGVIGLFVANNIGAWLDPDFTPGLKGLARRARGHGALVVYNDYHATAEYYADLPTTLVTDDRRAYTLFSSVRAMQEGARVEYVEPARLPNRIARSRPVAWLTTALFAPRLAAAVEALPPKLSQKLRVFRSGPYVLLLEQRP